MPNELLTRVVIRGEDRTGPALRSTRKGLQGVSDSIKHLQPHATAALSSLVLAGGAFETLRRGAANAVRAYADVETGLVGVAKTANLTGAGLSRLDRRLKTLSLTPDVGATRVEFLDIAQAAGPARGEGVPRASGDEPMRYSAR